MTTLNAVTVEIVKASLSGIVQEMQNSLFRTGFSTIVRESQDASCAIMNPQGDVIAQHVVLPLHMGAFPACCEGVLRGYGGDEPLVHKLLNPDLVVVAGADRRRSAAIAREPVT